MLGRSSLAKLLGIALTIVPALSHGQNYLGKTVYPTQLTNDEVRELMIQFTISSYKGICPCPYSPDLIGGICGTESAYYHESAPSRPGRSKMKCYFRDISNEEIYFWKLKYATPGFHGEYTRY